MLRYIMVPVVGAIIGYATNWIAVKMLFRPHHEVRIWGIKLPFTPGVIPKGQGRLARAVGKAVKEQLLTEEVLTRVLLSPDMKNKLREAVTQWMKKEELSDKTVMDLMCDVMPATKAHNLIVTLQEQVTAVIYEKIVAANIGKIVAVTVLDIAKEKLAESVLGMMMSGSMLDPIGEMVEVRINEFVADHAEEHIEKMVKEESDKIVSKPTGEFFVALDSYELDVPEIILVLYEKMVKDYLPQALTALDLTSIVEDRINSMEVAEVEELLLSIMKKELGAIVNLGALIGFVLGLVNVAILLI